MTQKKFRKGDIVTFQDSFTGWLVTGTQLLYTPKGRRRYLRLTQLPGYGAPRPGAEGVALPEDLFLR